MTSDLAHPHDHLRIMEHPQAVWGARADVQIDLVIPEVGDSLERLVVRSVGTDVYEVCCLPFALYDLSLGDVVEVDGLTRRTPGTIRRVVHSSGRFLFRVVLLDGGDGDRMRSLDSTFASMGCLTEVWSPMMIAVDAEDEPKADWVVAVLDQLVSGRTLGDLTYETVHVDPV